MTTEEAENRIAELEEEVARLKALLGAEWKPYERLPLSGHERKIAGLLVRAGEASHETIAGLLWGDRADGGPDDVNIHIKVAVCKLRKKLAALDVKIRTIYGFGYVMDKSDRDKMTSVNADIVFDSVKEHATIPIPRVKAERKARPAVPMVDRPKGKWAW